MFNLVLISEYDSATIAALPQNDFICFPQHAPHACAPHDHVMCMLLCVQSVWGEPCGRLHDPHMTQYGGEE